MEKTGKGNGNRYCFDDIVVERENFRVTKGGTSKSLTPRAFDLLVYLIERRGRVIEKQEIFEAIWKETFVTDNALMRAVKEIRRQLGDQASAPRYVETVHKRGYRFIGNVDEEKERRGKEETENDAAQGLIFEDDKPPIQNPKSKIQNLKWILLVLPIAILAAAAVAVWYFDYRRNTRQIESIAVLPFVDESGSAELEYLSDGMTES